MCLAIPARIVAIDGDSATVALGEVQKRVSLILLEEARIDDYVLIHVGYAISRISEEEARHTLELFAAAGLVGRGQ